MLYVNYLSIILGDSYVSIKLAFMTWLIKEADIFTNSKSNGLRKKWYLYKCYHSVYELSTSGFPLFYNILKIFSS